MGRHSRWRTARIKRPNYEPIGARPVASNEADGTRPVSSRHLDRRPAAVAAK
jgi:hypothetical protein